MKSISKFDSPMPQELCEEQLACVTGGTISLLGGGWPYDWCGTPVPKPLVLPKPTPTLDPYA